MCLIAEQVKLLRERREELIEKDFEFINHAVSTELDAHYVEEISPLGQSIKGLKQGDTFIVRRCHKPALKGVIDRVENVKVIEKERVF